MNAMTIKDTGMVANEAEVPRNDLSLADQMALRVLDSPELSVETIREILKMQNEQEDRHRAHMIEDRKWKARQEYNTSFNAVQKLLPQIVKNAKNKHGGYDYATMNAIDAAITPIITANGFGTTFREGSAPVSPEHMHVIIVLKHIGGHEEEYNCQVPIAGKGLKGNDAMVAIHGYGATKTYGRRYAKYDVWDLVVTDVDTDGNINNQSVSEEAQSLLDSIASTKTVEKLDLVHAEIMAQTKLNPSDRKQVISAFTFRRSALLKGADNE